MNPDHPSLRWYSTPNGTFLDYNAGCVAYVRPCGKVTLQAWGDFRDVQAESQSAGRALIEAWVAQQTGFPGMAKVGKPSQRRR